MQRCSAALTALGLRREDRVLLLMHDCSDWVVSFLGALHAGVVPVCVNTLLTAKDYAYMLADSRAQAALVSGLLLPTLQTAMDGTAHEVRSTWSFRAAKTCRPARAIGLRWWLRKHPAPAPTRTATNPLSGSIPAAPPVRPKGTVHTQANLYWTAELYGKGVLDLKESDVVFSAAKLFFAYGLGNALSFPLSVGASVVLMAERPTPQACFKRMVDHQPTVFYGAPTGYGGMLAAPDLPARSAVVSAPVLLGRRGAAARHR